MNPIVDKNECQQFGTREKALSSQSSFIHEVILFVL